MLPICVLVKNALFYLFWSYNEIILLWSTTHPSQENQIPRFCPCRICRRIIVVNVGRIYRHRQATQSLLSNSYPQIIFSNFQFL